MDEKTKKVLFHLIDSKTKGVDTYHHNGSMWLIFTDQKKWVIELSKDGTLWYNHYFFKDCFKYLSLDVVENQHYITEWVEDIIQNGVRNTDSWVGKPFVSVEYIIQNGIKETIDQWNQNRPSVKDVIEKGVKETTPSGYLGSIEMKGKIVHQFESPKQNNEVEDIIQNGVKETNPHYLMGDLTIEEVIQNGVKRTVSYKDRPEPTVEGIIQSGIKETKKIEHDRTTYHGYFNQERGSHTPLDTVQDVLKNGIKHTQPHVLEILNPIGFEPTLKENKRMNEVNNVLDKGIKEVIELPDQSGELNGYGEYYARQKNRTCPHTDTVNDVICDGIKETNWRTVDNFPEFEERVIQNGIKETWGYERQPQTRVNDVIQTGKKFDTQ